MIQAINICQQRPLINQDEINLLKQLLLTRSYSFTLTTACQSPAFIQAFKLEFPQATKLTTFDHYLFNNKNPLTPLVIDLAEISATITETHLTIFMQRLAQDKTETVTELMDVLKEQIHDLATKILKGPAPMMTASYQATFSTFFKNTKNELTSKRSAEKSTVNRLFQSKQL